MCRSQAEGGRRCPPRQFAVRTDAIRAYDRERKAKYRAKQRGEPATHQSEHVVAAIAAQRDLYLQGMQQEWEVVSKRTRDPEQLAEREAAHAEQVAAVNRLVDTVATWQPLPAPVPVPVETVKAWQETLSRPFERTRGLGEEERRNRALTNAEGKPVKQSTEVAADRLFALVTHRAGIAAEDYDPRGGNAHRRAYLEVFGDKDIAKMSPKQVAEKMPAYIEASTGVLGALTDAADGDVTDPWRAEVRKQVDRHIARGVGGSREERMREALTYYLSRDVPAEALVTRHRELKALNQRQAVMTDHEYKRAVELVGVKLAADTNSAPWDGENEDKDVDSLVAALRGSLSDLSGGDLRLNHGTPSPCAGRWKD